VRELLLVQSSMGTRQAELMCSPLKRNGLGSRGRPGESVGCIRSRMRSVKPNATAVRTLLWRLFRSALQVDVSGLSLRSGVFATFGVVVPLIVGFFMHEIVLGAVGAIGALLVGFAGFQRGYRSRLVTMSVALAVVSVCLVVGNSIHSQLLASAVFYLVVGATAGAALALGEAASTIGVQALVAFAIGSGLGVGASVSTSLALATTSGALLQVILTAIAIVSSRAPAPRSQYQCVRGLKNNSMRARRLRC